MPQWQLSWKELRVTLIKFWRNSQSLPLCLLSSIGSFRVWTDRKLLNWHERPLFTSLVTFSSEHLPILFFSPVIFHAYGTASSITSTSIDGVKCEWSLSLRVTDVSLAWLLLARSAGRQSITRKRLHNFHHFQLYIFHEGDELVEAERSCVCGLRCRCGAEGKRGWEWVDLIYHRPFR